MEGEVIWASGVTFMAVTGPGPPPPPIHRPVRGRISTIGPRPRPHRGSGAGSRGTVGAPTPLPVNAGARCQRESQWIPPRLLVKVG